jgi:hypothetical protein
MLPEGKFLMLETAFDVKLLIFFPSSQRNEEPKDPLTFSVGHGFIISKYPTNPQTHSIGQQPKIGTGSFDVHMDDKTEVQAVSWGC